MKKYFIFLCLLIAFHSKAQIWETNERPHKRELPSSNEIMQGVLVLVAILGVTYGVAAMRKGSSSMSKPLRFLSFNTNTPLEKAMKIIIQFANQSGYKIDDFNESKSIIVLSDSASLTSYGFFYPIYLSKQIESTHIEIGIKSKLFQWGPLVRRKHEKCLNGIKASLFANQ